MVVPDSWIIFDSFVYMKAYVNFDHASELYRATILLWVTRN